jgi:cyclopropane-fatty-acyl-phospholipid synthase
MNSENAEARVRDLLARAGVAVDGGRPWDIRVANPAFYRRALDGGSLAVGEAYADGWWEAERLDEFFHRVFKAGLHERLAPSPWSGWRSLAGRLFGRRGRTHAPEALGSDVFRAMLGRRMSGACAYWKDARALDDADEAALELACRKLELKAGMSVLDMGSGWGAFARYAAERHGVSVVGVDISQERVQLARELCKGLPVALRVQDYEEVRGRFDRVVSLGLMEHAGAGSCRAVMAAAARCLKADGVALIHTAARNRAAGPRERWPAAGVLLEDGAPALSRLAAAAEGLFVIEDVHNLGTHYAPTLLAWHENLARRWPGLSGRYGDRLYRTLTFGLLSTAGRFRARQGQLYQIVMTRPGRPQPRCRVEPAWPAAGSVGSPALAEAAGPPP